MVVGFVAELIVELLLELFVEFMLSIVAPLIPPVAGAIRRLWDRTWTLLVAATAAGFAGSRLSRALGLADPWEIRIGDVEVHAVATIVAAAISVTALVLYRRARAPR